MTLDDKIVEAVARAVFAEMVPHESWGSFDERFEARGNRLHPMQEQAVSIARAAITAYHAEAWQPVAWVIQHPRFSDELSNQPLTDDDMKAGYTQTPLYGIPAPKASP